MRISETVAKQIAYKLGHYVYVYINPIDNSVFYIGKGQGGRCLVHLEAGNKKVSETIKKLNKLGIEPKIQILAANCSEVEAHKIETAAIGLFGIDKLDNLILGRGSKHCRSPIEDVLASHSKGLRANITEPSVLIRIPQFYEAGMNDVSLYDATRSCWGIAEWAQNALTGGLAFSIFEKIIREVYEITGWHEGGTTFSTFQKGRRTKCKGKVEFVGVIADSKVRDKYLGRYVGHLFKKGQRLNFMYKNI